jgi:phosphonate transport system permease protein
MRRVGGQSIAGRSSSPAAASESAVAIEVERVTLHVGDGIVALRDVSLAVRRGEHAAIVGPSGSGKTSLLNAIAGDLSVAAGVVRINGTVGRIYQDFRLVGTASARSNVLHGAAAEAGLVSQLLGYARPLRARADALLARLGLAARAGTRVDRLSGGEQQRVAIARALMRRPSIVLADEAFSALDTASARALLGVLRQLARDEGLTIVSVMHDADLAAEFADRVVWLDGARSASASSQASVPVGATPGDDRSADVVPLRKHTPAPALEIDAPSFAVSSAGRDRPAWWRWLGRTAALAALCGVSAVAVSALQIEWPRDGAGANVLRFGAALVPSASQWAALDLAALGAALVATFWMAWLGTLLAGTLSLPLAALAARGVAPGSIRATVRALLNAIRAVPSLLWALLAVGAFGLGALPGIIALAAYSVGYLSKFFYEAFEAVDPRVPSALESLGLSRAQVFCAATAPASRLALLSALVFMLEYNFRTATVLGIVGAGGIGYELKLAVDWGNWHVVGAILCVLVVAVMLFDAIADRLRARLL